MSRVFINAKTEMICGTISTALEDAGAEITCCFDDEEAAAADLSGYDVVIVSTPLRSEFGLNYVAEIHDRTSAVIIVLAKTEIADEVQNRIKFTGAKCSRGRSRSRRWCRLSEWLRWRRRTCSGWSRSAPSSRSSLRTRR